jgi:transcription antitermination factor NusG
MSNWYCIRTATRQEQKVVDGLHDLASLRSIPLDVYLPCETRWNRMARVKVPKHVPMLPGYLFLNIEPDQLWRVDKLDGVYQILGWGSELTLGEALKMAKFVGTLRAKQEAGDFDLTQAKGRGLAIEPGEKIRVSAGSWAGWVGEIVAARGHKRVKVLLSALGAMKVPPKAAEVAIADLEPQDAVPKEAA